MVGQFLKMKTDIFKDLSPLLKMNLVEIDNLSKDIVQENKSKSDKENLESLIVRIDFLAEQILEKL